MFSLTNSLQTNVTLVPRTSLNNKNKLEGLRESSDVHLNSAEISQSDNSDKNTIAELKCWKSEVEHCLLEEPNQQNFDQVDMLHETFNLSKTVNDLLNALRETEGSSVVDLDSIPVPENLVSFTENDKSLQSKGEIISEVDDMLLSPQVINNSSVVLNSNVNSPSEGRKKCTNVCEHAKEDIFSKVEQSEDSDGLFSFEEVGTSMSPEGHGDFVDAVFIEANHLADRISDGSILDLGDNENYMLDSTNEPEDFAGVTDEIEQVKYNTETVFKIVDKTVLPPLSSKNLSSNNSSKSDVAKVILGSLSEIFNNSNPTEEQRTKGKNLLSSLADILNTSNTRILDDSGHSSIYHDVSVPLQPNNWGVLDLRKKSRSENDMSKVESYESLIPLDLSVKSRKPLVPSKFLPSKCGGNQQRSLTSSNLLKPNNHTLRTNRSLSGLSDVKVNSIGAKLPNKKGPLKAVIPLESMAKRKSLGRSNSQQTPTKVEADGKRQKSTTPLNESHVKPIAQSTPDTPKSTNHKSALSVNNVKQNQSKIACLTRTSSVVEMKRSANGRKILRRTHSAEGKKLGPPDALKTTKTLRKSYLPSSNSIHKDNTRLIRPINKKTGKENMNM